ncbi:sensor histidine kinase [Roseivirga pacifica]|uniref:sensor histidine kinase n=1 Tax=Roseivirga pacifica TaxID=1267423 RepID=UPI00227CEAAB|nr:histidine kinase [Roseivirga pacifica]
MPKINFEKLLFHTPRLLWHVLFWVIYISFFAIVYGSFEENYGKFFLIQLTDALVQVPAVYIALYVLMPKYLFKEKFGQFFVYLVLLILLFSMLAWFEYLYIQHPIFWPQDSFQSPLINVGKILKYTTKIYPVVVLAVVAKWFKYWYIEQKRTQQLAEDKLEAELKFLKAQVHPHFLFNTLNNLYALTLKQSKEAPEMVLKLSELLNYMLYECNADKVQLKKELELVQDYIALEKVRYGDRLNVSFNVQGNTASIELSPLLILPFVENAFKHGVSEELDESWVSIELELKEKSLTLKVENSKSNNGNHEDRFAYKQGIGLKNVKRRLELLYPEKHDLNILDSSDSYLVVLKLFF